MLTTVTSSTGRRAYSPGAAYGHFGALFAPSISATMRYDNRDRTGGEDGPHDAPQNGVNTDLVSMLIGYARVSTERQDLTAQRQALLALGVDDGRIYTDRGLSGRNRDRPGLGQAIAACRSGDTLVVAKLDRLARSVPDAAAIAAELAGREVALSLGGTVYDPTDPVGKLMFTTLAMVAEFEADLISARTKEGMAIARAQGKLKGRQPKLTAAQQRHVRELAADGRHTQSDIAELFGVSRRTIGRILNQ